MRRRTQAVVVVGIMTVTLAGGCRVDQHKDGKNENVKIATPFGGVSVKTDDAVIAGEVGLSPYPGATAVSTEKGNKAADVNLNFGSFHLGVKALSYRTADAPDKVLAFYRADMARYGTVVLCRAGKPIGTPTHTAEGLSCDHANGDTNIQTEDEGSAGELKAGSKQRQHIVAVDPEGSGTKFGLVALDLPSHLEFGDGTHAKEHQQ